MILCSETEKPHILKVDCGFNDTNLFFLLILKIEENLKLQKIIELKA